MVNLLNMFTKLEFKVESCVPVCWNYGKWCISTVRSTVPLVDHSLVKVRIFALPYKLTPSFTEIFFFRLKKLTCMLQCTVQIVKCLTCQFSEECDKSLVLFFFFFFFFFFFPPDLWKSIHLSERSLSVNVSTSK